MRNSWRYTDFSLLPKLFRCSHCQTKFEPVLEGLSPEEREELAKQLFQPNEPCRRCGEVVWQFESVSPNMRSATWLCGYCGRKQIGRGDAKPSPNKVGLRLAIPKAVQREV